MFLGSHFLCSLLVVSVAAGITNDLFGQDGSGSPLIGWDTILDPDDDCQIKSTIRITVPKARHGLNPTRRHQIMNAPRLLKKVDGDFTAQVKVTGDFDPSIGNGRFVSAGMVIWEDESHFMRIERSGLSSSGEMKCEYPPVEHFRNGTWRGFPPRYPPIAGIYEGRTTWLRVQRKDGKLAISISNDGKKWKVATEREDVFREEVSVGLHVINDCAAKVTFDFEAFDIQFH